MSDNLRAYVSLILEKAKGAKDLLADELALVMIDDDDEKVLVLYNPAVLMRRAKRGIAQAKKSQNFNKRQYGEENPDLNFSLVDLDHDESGGLIVGMMVLKSDNDSGPCYGGAVVARSAAKGGYGPILYDIAMSLSPNKTLSPDRGSISNAASGVWKYYFNNRKDVKALPFDDIDDPKTPPKIDDCDIHPSGGDWLNFAYRMKGSPKATSLMNNHKRFMKDLIKLVDDNGGDAYGDDILDLLNATSEAFFWKKYGYS